jgi:hypothetical protein
MPKVGYFYNRPPFLNDDILLLTGKEQGDIELDANTGMLMNFSKKTKLDGNCKIGDVNVHQGVIGTFEIIGHRTGMSW